MKTYVVSFGKSAVKFYTHYHAEQFARALRLNGTPFRLRVVRVAR